MTLFYSWFKKKKHWERKGSETKINRSFSINSSNVRQATWSDNCSSINKLIPNDISCFLLHKAEKVLKALGLPEAPSHSGANNCLQKRAYSKKVYKILSNQGCTEVSPLGADSFWTHATDIKVPLCKPAGFWRDLDSCAYFGILQHPSQGPCLWPQNSCNLSI